MIDASAVHLTPADYRRTPWKNGGGETMEIAISPAGASLDDFDWRISLATVASDGPFSVFAGVDRTLCILDGAGIHLRVGDAHAQRLDAASDPVAFSGDAPAFSELIDGAVTDFNVMTRRSRLTHTVERVHLQAGDQRELATDVRAVFCQAGMVTLGTTAVCVQLAARDTVLRPTGSGARWRLRADTNAAVCVVSMTG